MDRPEKLQRIYILNCLFLHRMCSVQVVKLKCVETKNAKDIEQNGNDAFDDEIKKDESAK